ncbi:hypothetical protein ACWCP8_31995 [Streptomyces sp. NPDC002206]
MKPLLDTSSEDLAAPLAFSVYGPATAVQQVLPGVRQLGRGTVVFVNGGTAVRPHPDRAGTSVAFAAESAYGQLLHDALQAENIHVAQLIIPGAITPGDPRKDPDVFADTLWQLHTSRGPYRTFAEPLDT